MPLLEKLVDKGGFLRGQPLVVSSGNRTGRPTLGEDLHLKRAAKVFEVPEEQVTPEQRLAGKRANYFDLYKKEST
jgi:hypothetical protein